MANTLLNSIYLGDSIRNFNTDNENIGAYGWIPFHVVTCSSEEYGTSIDALTSTE